MIAALTDFFLQTPQPHPLEHATPKVDNIPVEHQTMEDGNPSTPEPQQEPELELQTPQDNEGNLEQDQEN